MTVTSDTSRVEIPPWILPVIVIAQFATTSLWFSGNAIMPDLRVLWDLPPSAVGTVTSAVQLGFVLGTLTFAVLAISDRFPASHVFLFCALAGALCNLSIYLVGHGLLSLVLLRFLTGFFLAGVYPVGMKIAASWCVHGLGRALGYLVGALVLGTAFPHLLRGMGAHLDWKAVLISVSVIAALGGFAVYALVPPGPHLVARSPFDIHALPRVFASRDLRSAAFGYFGHMWEIYTLWAFTPAILRYYGEHHGLADLNVSLWSFFVIAAGALGCAVGGLVAFNIGSARVAFFQLAVSGAACLLSPLMFQAPPPVFFTFMIVWGVTVAGDSPQFSTLTAGAAPRAYVGTALTIVNCIGFAITAVSIQVMTVLGHVWGMEYLFLALAPGPLLGLLASRRLL